MPSDADDWMVIGTIAGSFGIRGEAKIQLNTDFPERFRKVSSVHVGPKHLSYKVQSSRMHKGQVLLRLEGVDTPEQVDVMRGQELMVPRSDAVVLPEGHFYLDDVLGIEVITREGVSLGAITDVLRTGSNDVFVVNEGKGAILIPVIKDAITDLDLSARRVVIEPWVLNVEE
jgi:16S rRNA processing protein RimM